MSNAKQLIAVVDDDESVRRAVRRLLRSYGLAADTFGTGGEFLDQFDSMPGYRPACIVLDVRLVGLSGLDVQRRLAGSGIPVIFITAHDDDPGAQEQALAAGATAYLHKPFSDRIFIEAIHKAIGF